MLTVKNVTKKYGKLTVLDDICLDFNNGIYGLVSPNGAGKTTLLKMLATLLFPTSGEILWNGTNIIKLDEKYREIIGFLPQQFGYYKDYTPVKYLRYIAALKGINDNVKTRVDSVLSMVALDDVADKKMKKLSGGMIQRVGIAQALLNDPKILLFDEPTAGLAPKERVRFRNIISSLSKDKIVLLSTHIVSDIESVANNIIMLKDGKALFNDTVRNICAGLDANITESVIDIDKLNEFSENHRVLSQKCEGTVVKVRAVSDGMSVGNTVTPTLEDVFLYYFGD